MLPDTETEELSDIVSDEDAATESDSGDAAPRRRVWLRRTVAGIVVLLLLGSAGALGFTLYQQAELQRLRTASITVTHDYLVAMASFDYRNLDANKAVITAQSTPEFAHKYDEMVRALRDIVMTSKGVATATANHVAVERLDRDAATVVGFVDQHVVNVTAPQGNDQRYRMVVTLNRVSDRWVVANVETV